MGGSARTIAMVAVAVVAAVAAPYLASFIAEGMGTLILGEEAAVLGAEGFTAAEAIDAAAATSSAIGTGSSVAAGAVTGAAAGAGQAELAGTDPWTGAFSGALAGGVGSAVSGAVGGLLPEGTPDALKAGVKGATSGFTSAELKGKSLEQALAAGAAGGITGAATSALFPQGFLGSDSGATEYQVDEEGNPILDDAGKPIPTQASADAKTQSELASIAEKGIRGLGGAYIGQNVSSLFAPSSPATAASSSSKGYSTPAPTYSASGTQLPSYISSTAPSGYGGATTTGQSTTQGQPGSQALAQALRVGDPSNAGTSVESPSQGTGSQQNVWNTASLRFKDETGSDV
jgi:hypothetical protein